MAEFASVRIQMTDRPGALSAVGAALAANGVDIVRLDVVSHEGAFVVDDLFLKAATKDDLDRALGSFFTDVTVERLPGDGTDAVTLMGAALGDVARAATPGAAAKATVAGAVRLLHASRGLLVNLADDGRARVVAGEAAGMTIAPPEPFAGRWVAANASTATFMADPDWAPEHLREAVGGRRVAVAPCGSGAVLVVVRDDAVPFYAGELERLTVFADTAGAFMAAIAAPAALA